MFVPLPLIFNSIKLATMNNKRKDKDPLFAEVKLTGDSSFYAVQATRCSTKGTCGMASVEWLYRARI